MSLWTSLNPTVVMVVTVMYRASKKPQPSMTTYPVVPTTNTVTMATATHKSVLRSRPHAHLAREDLFSLMAVILAYPARTV